LLDILFVALRFKARAALKKTNFASDDWVILAALIVQLAATGDTIYGAVRGGEGASEEELGTHPKEYSIFAMQLFVGPILFALTMLLIKTSTVLFYKRIFARGSFGVVCNIMMGLFMCWFLASLFGQIFASNPVSLGWKSANHNAINYPVFFVSMAASNLALDLATLTLPLFVIRTLQMTTRRKYLVSGIFGLGLMCIVASTVRLYYFAQLVEKTNAVLSVVTDDTIWSFLESCMSIIAACLPTLAPLFRNIRDVASLIASVRSALSLQSLSSGRANRSNGQSSTKDTQITDTNKPWQKLGSVPGTSCDNIVEHDINVELDIIHNTPPDKIMVHRTFDAQV